MSYFPGASSNQYGAALTRVLPTDRLNGRGRPIGPLRDELRRIPQARNAANVVSLYLQSFGLIALTCWLTVQVPWPAALALWAVTFVLIGPHFGARQISPSMSWMF